MIFSNISFKLIENIIRINKKYRITIIVIVIIFLLAKIISAKYYQLLLVQGTSMEPSITNPQIVIINKMGKEKYCEGDIVAFECEKLDSVLVKRIVAVPGQTVQIKNATLFIDGACSNLYKKGEFEYAGILKNKVTLSEDEYIVFGDNISVSKDSRYSDIGIVNYSAIIGYIEL